MIGELPVLMPETFKILLTILADKKRIIMPKSHDVKVDVELHFLRWKLADEPVPLALAADDSELNSNTIFEGTISVSPTTLYSIIKQSKEAGLIPVFEMAIPEDPQPQKSVEIDKKDDDQGKLNFQNDPPADPENPDKEDKPEKKDLTAKPNVR